MNRKEYLEQLAELLQDISEEEKAEALQYYNDYFDEAGEENEHKVIAELGNPEKVAAEMKAGLNREGEEAVEFRETGYSDIRFEEKDIPIAYQKERSSGKEEKGQSASQYEYQEQYQEQNTNQYEYTGKAASAVGKEEKPWTNRTLKIVLCIILVVCAGPVVLPIVFAVLVVGAVIACIPIIVAAVLLIVGVSLLLGGIANLISDTAVALVLMGVGLILGAIGLVGTVTLAVLCFRLIVKLFNWAVSICKKLFL